MATLSLVKQAIIALKDRTGSSVPAINKYLEQNEKVCAVGLPPIANNFSGFVGQ
jgi:linker histone H1 and H5 family